MADRFVNRAAFLAIASLVLLSCGGGSKGTLQAGPSTSAQLTTTSPASTLSTAISAERAKGATLQLVDLPAGWKLQEPGEGLDLDIIWRDITRCLGIDAAEATPGGTSPTFLRGLATQAQSTVEYPTESTAGAIGGRLAGTQYQQCATGAFTDDVKRNAPEGGRLGPVSVVPLDVPHLGARMFASRIRVDISLDELKVPIYQDFLVVFTRQAVIRFLFLNPGAAFPGDLEQSLVATVVGRA